MSEKKCGFIINTGEEISKLCWEQFTGNECAETTKNEIEKNIKEYSNEKEKSSKKIYEIIEKYA